MARKTRTKKRNPLGVSSRNLPKTRVPKTNFPSSWTQFRKKGR